MSLAFKFIFFDFDNTLVNSEFCYEQALNAIGLSQNNAAYAQARQQVKTMLGKGHVCSHNRLLYLKELLSQQNHFSATHILDKMKIYEEKLSFAVKSQWDSLLRNKLFSVLKKNFQLGVITNENTRTQLIKLQAIDPQGKLFSVFITSEEIGVEKPNPLIYQHALMQAKVDAKNCIFVGDDLAGDILAPQKIGFRVFETLEFKNTTTSNSNEIKSWSTLKKLDDLIEALNV